jgi:hypothetical protein
LTLQVRDLFCRKSPQTAPSPLRSNDESLLNLTQRNALDELCHIRQYLYVRSP